MFCRVRYTERVFDVDDESEEIMTLWIMGYDDGSGERWSPIHYVPFYVSSAEEVEQKVQQWLAKRLYPVRRLSLQEYPNGFQVWHSHLPGMMQRAKSDS
jgi:hypothetical protein